MVISIRSFSVSIGIFMVKILSLQVSLAFSIFILPSIFRYHPEIIFFFFFLIYFIFKLYITVLVLPNIKMNLPQVYKRLIHIGELQLLRCAQRIKNAVLMYLSTYLPT